MVRFGRGVFSFGDAKFWGSMGATQLNAPVRSLVADADGAGDRLVASDGGVFAFNAPFNGSMGSVHLNQPITGMVRFGNGYLIVARQRWPPNSDAALCRLRGPRPLHRRHPPAYTDATGGDNDQINVRGDHQHRTITASWRGTPAGDRRTCRWTFTATARATAIPNSPKHP